MKNYKVKGLLLLLSIMIISSACGEQSDDKSDGNNRRKKRVPESVESTNESINEATNESSIVITNESNDIIEENPIGGDINISDSATLNVLEYKYELGYGDLDYLFGIEEYDSDVNWYYLNVDMDNNHEEETFIIVDLEGSIYGNGISGDLWFYGNGFATKIKPQTEVSYPYEYDLTATGYDFGNEIKVIQNFSPAVVNRDGYILEYKDNMISYPYGVPHGQKEYASNGAIDIFVESYSMCSDGTGHCYVPHRYVFEADEWVPMQYEEITIEEATKLSGYDIETMFKSVIESSGTIEIDSIDIDKIRLEEDERIIASLEYKLEGDSDYSMYATVFIDKVYYSGFTSSSEWQFSYTPGQYDCE